MRTLRSTLLAVLAACTVGAGPAQPPVAATLTVDLAHPGAAINPAMWGAFFEDINFAADGGLWAELVKNGNFEFPDPLQGWSEVRAEGARGTLTVRSEAPAIAGNPHYLSLRSPGAGYGAGNDGFRGIGLKAGEQLRLSLRLRSPAPAALRAVLRGDAGKVLAEGRITGIGADWARYGLDLKAAAGDPGARLELTLEQPGRIDLDAVSLMPADTWKGHGFRADLMRLLVDLKPGFLRFPGGCVVEGRDLANRYDWKRTLGPAEARRPMPNRWRDNMAFEGRFMPDYQQSFQLGFYEYFQLCEDLGAAPLPVLGCGMACQFETAEMAPLDELQPYVQDALDLIEFANGDAGSRWGKVRAEMGHPAPFGLTMLAIGNEQWGPEYLERFQAFQRAIKARYPAIQLAGSAGPWSGGVGFDELWAGMRATGADLVDEHTYAPPGWFLGNAHRFDNYPRTGAKVFFGEYAAHPERPAPGTPRPNNWEAALAEAAFMTGLERNAEVVRLASYAPLLAHGEAWQWSPNLIWFDNLTVAATPSYWVQRLFAGNRGDRVLPVQLALAPAASISAGLFSTAALDEAAGEVVLKLVNAGRRPVPVDLALTGRKLLGTGRKLVLAGDPADQNPLGAPAKLAPAESAQAAAARQTLVLPGSSLTILRFALAKEAR